MATAKRKSKTRRGSMAGFSQVSAPSTATNAPAKGRSAKVLESIRIEVAANGFTVSCSHSGGDYPEPYRSPKPMVFDTVEATLAHVGGELRKAGGGAKKSSAPKKKSASRVTGDDGVGGSYPPAKD